MPNNLSIIGQPDHFVDGVICPFCKQPTLGVITIPVDEGRVKYGMTCMYSDCILNFTSPVSWEIDELLRNMVEEGTLPQWVENTLPLAGLPASFWPIPTTHHLWPKPLTRSKSHPIPGTRLHAILERLERFWSNSPPRYPIGTVYTQKWGRIAGFSIDIFPQ